MVPSHAQYTLLGLPHVHRQHSERVPSGMQLMCLPRGGANRAALVAPAAAQPGSCPRRLGARGRPSCGYLQNHGQYFRSVSRGNWHRPRTSKMTSLLPKKTPLKRGCARHWRVDRCARCDLAESAPEQGPLYLNPHAGEYLALLPSLLQSICPQGRPFPPNPSTLHSISR